MRKLVFAINITLDGCVDHTKGMVDKELHDFHTNLLRTSDTFLYGRKTYELMVPFWPDVARNNSGEDESMNEFARTFDEVKRIVVFSKTLKDAVDGRTVLISTDLKEAVQKLKQEDGKDILTGGVDIPSQLIALDLVDELHLVVHPLVVGEGRRLLENYSLQKVFRLINTKVFKSGTVALHYKKDDRNE